MPRATRRSCSSTRPCWRAARSSASTGGTGKHSLNGAGGNDVLTGGAGLDVFQFSSALNAVSNVDRITDLNVVDDRIQLANAGFTKPTALGVLSVNNFRANLGGTAVDADDYILYDTDSGQLYYDADGSGAGARILIATLTGLPVLTAADIFVT